MLRSVTAPLMSVAAWRAQIKQKPRNVNVIVTCVHMQVENVNVMVICSKINPGGMAYAGTT